MELFVKQSWQKGPPSSFMRHYSKKFVKQWSWDSHICLFEQNDWQLLIIEPEVRLVMYSHWQIVSQRLQTTKFFGRPNFHPRLRWNKTKWSDKSQKGGAMEGLWLTRGFQPFSFSVPLFFFNLAYSLVSKYLYLKPSNI